MIAKPMFLSEGAIGAFNLDDNRKIHNHNTVLHCLCVDNKYCESK